MSDRLEQFPTNLEARLEEMTIARTQLLAQAESIKNDDAVTGTGADNWSVAEIIFHLHLTEKRTLTGLKRALESPTRGPRADDVQLRTEWERIRVVVGQRTTKVKAPPRVEPTNAPQRAEALALIQQSRRELLTMLQTVSYPDLLAVSMPHPFEAVGTLTGAGWLSAIAVHELRHVEQLREMKAS